MRDYGNSPNALVFDLDDTLFDRNRAQREVLDLIVPEFRVVFGAIDKEKIAAAFFESDRVTTQEFEAGVLAETFRRRRSKLFLNLLDLNEDLADQITAMYVRRYPTIDAPVSGAKSVVQNLAGRFPLGLVSNGLPDVQYRKLETLGIRGLFKCIVLSGEVGIQKPDPRIFWLATASLVREPEECLYVGDSYAADVVGAKSAGMQVCWFNPQGTSHGQAGIEPDFEITALDEIFGILNGL